MQSHSRFLPRTYYYSNSVYGLVIDRWLSQCQAVVEKLVGEKTRRPNCQNACLPMMLLWCVLVERAAI